MNENHKSDGTFAEKNEAYLQHGGEGAVKRIQHGEPFTGLAAQEERNVNADLETQGRVAMVREQAIVHPTHARVIGRLGLPHTREGDWK